MLAPIRAGVSKYMCSCELHRSSADMQTSGMFRGGQTAMLQFIVQVLIFCIARPSEGKQDWGSCIFVRRQPTFLKSRGNKKLENHLGGAAAPPQPLASDSLSCDPNNTNNFKWKALTDKNRQISDIYLWPQVSKCLWGTLFPKAGQYSVRIVSRGTLFSTTPDLSQNVWSPCKKCTNSISNNYLF